MAFLKKNCHFDGFALDHSLLPLPLWQACFPFRPLPKRDALFWAIFSKINWEANGLDRSQHTSHHSVAHSLIEEGSRVAQKKLESALDLTFPFISQNRYQLIQVLGMGGMGKVWKTLDKQTRRMVALKRLLVAPGENTSRLERFKREANSIAKLNHPYIVPLFDLGRDEEGPFLTMQYVEGVHLRDYVEQRGKLDIDEGVSLMIKIGQAIFYAHRHSVIHRDLKPENIMIDGNGLPRILDFGLARMGLEGDISLTGTVLGTQFYASPEQFKDASRVDHRADLYSLGATLYFILSGELPRVVRPDRIPPPLIQIVLKCLEERVEKRYYSTDRLVEDLEKIQHPAKVSPSLPKSPVASPLKKIIKGLCPCGHTNDRGVEFCENCGAVLFRKCPACSKKISINVKNCGTCGTLIARRDKYLQVLEEAKQYLDRYELKESIQKAQEALAIEDLPSASRFLLQVKTLQEQFDLCMQRGDQAFERGDYADSIPLYHRALHVIPQSQKAKDQVELAKKKRYQQCLEEARNFLEKENFSGAQRWCLEAKKLQPSGKVDEILRFVEEEIIKAKERELEETLREISEDEDENEDENEDEFSEDGSDSKITRELVQLVRKFNETKEKKTREARKHRKHNQRVKKFAEGFFFVVFWVILAFVIVLIGILIFSFWGKLI